MYETHPKQTPPQSSLQTLWRYYTEERLLDLLNSSELFFTNLTSFNDRLEGLLTVKARSRLFQWYVARGSTPFNATLEVERYEKLRAQFYANCWHTSNHESYLMWKAYADRGYAIQTTFERLTAAIDDFSGTISGSMVNYIDYSTDDVELGNVFTLAHVKDLPYRDEREFRLLFWRSDPRNSDYPVLTNGTRIKISLDFLVQRVYVSPFINNASNRILDALQRLQLPLTSSLIKIETRRNPES